MKEQKLLTVLKIRSQKVYTTDVIVEEQEFAESKKAAGQQDGNNGGYSDAGDGFMNIPDGIDEELPFN